MSCTSKLTLILALVLSCIPAFGQSGNSGGIKTTNSPFAGAVLITDGTRYYWATPTNLQANVTNAQPPSTTLTNLSATGVAPGATNASAYVGSNGGKGTNNQFWGTTTNVSLYVTSASEFLDNVTIGGELNILGYPNVADSLDSLQGRQGGSGVLTNLSGTGALTNASTRDFYNTGGNLYSKNLSLNHRWVYYDDFNQPMTTPGVFPDSPTGHKYNVFTGGGGNTNKINLVDGKWWLGETGAVYQSVTFGTNGVYGSAAPINTWGGTFSYQRSTNSTPDGYEQNLFFILSPRVDFLSTNYLHITVGANIFRVQRELSSTNIIYAQHFGGRYLAFDTNHSFTVTIISNNIICDIAGMRYVGYDESLSTTYGNIKVATWEAIGSPTNQFWGKWDSEYFGYAQNAEHWQYAGPFAVRSNGVLSRVTSTNFTLSVDDAYASGWNGSLDVPSKNAIYDKIETLGAGAQTPWAQDINGATYNLTNVGSITQVGDGVTPSSISLYETNGTKYSQLISPNQIHTNNVLRLPTNDVAGVLVASAVDYRTNQLVAIPILIPGQYVTYNGTAYVASNLPAGGGSQTPWAQDVSGGGFSLTNTYNVPIIVHRSGLVTGVTNSTTETDFVNYTIPGGTMGTNKAIEVFMSGNMIMSESAGVTNRLRIYMGGTLLYDDQVTPVSNTTEKKWFTRFTIQASDSQTAQSLTGFHNQGATGTATTGTGDISTDESSSAAAFGARSALGTDTNITLRATWTLTPASPTVWIDRDQLTVQLK